MDLLASLGLGNALPEQSTRLMSHPGIIKALENSSSSSNNNNRTNDDTNANKHDDDDYDDGVRLGFNHCLNCGIRLFVDSTINTKNGNVANAKVITTTTTTTCKGCNRVKYCSKACRIQDSKPVIMPPSSSSSSQSTTSLLLGRRDNNNTNGDSIDGMCEDGNGHSPVVCSLLRLCNDDEDAEDELLGFDHEAKKKTRKKKKMTTTTTSCGSERNNESTIIGGGSSWKQKEAAKYRIQTERESYPATLFNILSEGPDWFVESITRRLRCNMDVQSPKLLPEERKKQQQQQQQKRRGKRERSSLPSPIVETGKRGRDEFLSEDGDDDDVHGRGRRRDSIQKRELVLHIVGASTNSELWGWDMSSSSGSSSARKHENDVPVLNAYAEASTNLSSYLKNLLEIPSITIRCVFIGPDCPDTGKGASFSSSPPVAAASHVVVQVPIPDEDSSSTLTMETYRCKYGGQDQPYLPYPDVIVFFNPGFSCPDYDWSAALTAAMAYQYSSSSGGGGGIISSSRSSAIPFLITTNTEMEGLADIKYLLDGGYVDEKSLSRDLLELIDQPLATNGGEEGRYAKVEEYFDDDDRVTSFFGENPYAGLRVRQSGTMANDLYVKNRWIIGGLFRTTGVGGAGGRSARSSNGRLEQQRSKKQKSGHFNPDYDEEYDEAGRTREANKVRHRDEGQGGPKGRANNEKRKNPALI